MLQRITCVWNMVSKHMKVAEIWTCRLLLVVLFFQSDMGRTVDAQASQGFIESSCLSNIFWMKLDKSFLENKFYSVDIIDSSGVIIPITKTLEARCGYVLTSDVWGNTIFRASFLGCHVLNKMDERFYLNVNIRVSLFQDLSAATNYQHSMHCIYSPWAPREIICEENYMEVSVKSDIPVISDDETAEWMSALPEAQKVAYQMWELIFYSPSGRKRIVVSDADKLGYSFNNTLARVFLRSPYYTNETEQSVISGVTMSTVSSTSMYKQRWMLLLIDTTVSCPVDGTSFTDETITWTVPNIIPTLVLQKSTFTSLNVSMGVDGQRLINPEELNYKLEQNATHVGITIPIGAYGGRFQSTVSDGVHGVTYSIDLLLEHAWTDKDWQLTKYTVIKPITTPFIPRIPTIFDSTVPETRLFDITLGVFLPDVTLITLAIGGVPLSLKEAEQQGYRIFDTPFPNGTKGFNLLVPFDDPNVLKEYVNKNETKYHLHVDYTMSVGPQQKIYYHPADIEYILADIELPKSVGYCDKENMYLVVPITTFYQYWTLYVGNKPLNQATALANGCLLTTNSTHLLLQVPLFAVGIIYEEVSFDGIQARFDVALKKTSTLETLNIFSVRCSFRTSEFIVCYPNGTVTVSAVMKTEPFIDMEKTRLKDKRCKPVTSTKERAFFQFHVSACGTSLRFEGEYLIYENEIFFEKEILPALGPPTITRDPEYRITIMCYYPVKETLMQSVMFYGSSYSGTPPPFGYGTLMTRSNIAGFRNLRQVLNVIAKVFKDEHFMDTYVPHSGTGAQSWEPIFLEVELKDEVPDKELFLDNCWMAVSEEFNSTPQWNFIEDACVNESSALVSFYPVTISERVKYPNHFKRVKIQMLTLPLKEVFFHCTVTAGICHSAHGDGLLCQRCLPKEMHGENFEIHPTWHGYVVAGPVSVIHPDRIQEMDEQIRSSHTV